MYDVKRAQADKMPALFWDASCSINGIRRIIKENIFNVTELHTKPFIFVKISSKINGFCQGGNESEVKKVCCCR